jgi:hypothetical protein
MDELICMFDSGGLSPHIICCLEHYLIYHNHSMIQLNNYYLASRFSCQSYSGGSVCKMIDLSQYCIEKVIEVCAVKIKIGIHLIILLCVYKSPSGNFGKFAVQLDLILKSLYHQKLEYIICSDFDVNFLIHSCSAQPLTLFLQTYTGTLFHITDFSIRMTKDSSRALYNIFIDYGRINSFQVFFGLMGSLIMKLNISV